MSWDRRFPLWQPGQCLSPRAMFESQGNVWVEHSCCRNQDAQIGRKKRPDWSRMGQILAFLSSEIGTEPKCICTDHWSWKGPRFILFLWQYGAMGPNLISLNGTLHCSTATHGSNLWGFVVRVSDWVKEIPNTYMTSQDWAQGGSDCHQIRRNVS